MPIDAQSAALIIRHAHVLCLDDGNHEWDNADIVMVDGRIVAIGPDAATKWTGSVERTIDAKGMLAMPGLINAHFHSPGNLMKGALDGLPLELFMLYEVPPLADEGSALGQDLSRLTYVRTMIGALEMLRRGITTVHDDAYHVPVVTRENIDAIMQAYSDSGIRAAVAIDQPNIVEYDKYPYLRELLPLEEKERMDASPFQSAEELVSLYEYLIGKWHGTQNGRLSAAVSCSAPQRVTKEYFRALSALSKQHDIPFNIHILETRLQRVLGQEVFGQSLVKYVHELGLLDERMMVIHSIWVDDEDIALLAQSGCTVAHNPVCNLRLGSGVMPWRKLMDAGVPICLGTDEMNTDDTTNLWFVAKVAGMIHSLSNDEPSQWSQAAEVLNAATRGGARAIRRSADLGQLREGFIADICLIDLDTHAFTPLNSLIRQLVYCEDGSSVRMTIVNGKIVFEQGKIAGVDEKALRAEARALTAKLASATDALNADAARLAPYYIEMLRRAREVDVGMDRRLSGMDRA